MRRSPLLEYFRQDKFLRRRTTHVEQVSWLRSEDIIIQLAVQGGAIKTGPPYLIANTLKLHDRIARKLVNFYNIIC